MKNRDGVQLNSAQNWQKVKETVPCVCHRADIRKAYRVTQEHCSSTKSSTVGCHSAGMLICAGMLNSGGMLSPLSLRVKFRSTQSRSQVEVFTTV